MMVLVFILISILFLLIGKTKYNWMNQFLFLTILVIFVHALLIYFECLPVFLVIVSFMSFSFLTLIFFAMIKLKSDFFTVKISKGVMGVTVLVLSVFISPLIFQFNRPMLPAWISGNYSEINADNFMQGLREVFLMENFAVNVSLAAFVLICLIFCFEVVYKNDNGK